MPIIDLIKVYMKTLFRSVLLLFAIVSMQPALASAQTLSVLYQFTGDVDGKSPQTGVIFDETGNLIGTTALGGGASYCGTVYQLSPTGSGTWTESTLYTFQGLTDGCSPAGGLIRDPAGNIYGVTQGDYRLGAKLSSVFQLSQSAGGGWTKTTLHVFVGAGVYPQAPLVIDLAGNLYGSTLFGGTYNLGMIYELSPSGSGTWTQTILHSFGAPGDGQYPNGGLVFDHEGILYGTTGGGGSFGKGTAFQLRSSGNGRWKESTIYNFDSTLGTPVAGFTMDTSGSLFGTTWDGGPYESGLVFELSPDVNNSWTPSILYTFRGLYNGDGAQPSPQLLLDKGRDLWGTTPVGGGGGCGFGCGTIFRLSPNSDGTWTEVSYIFDESLAIYPPANTALVVDQQGNLFGTTNGGGTYYGGVVFELVRAH